MSDLDEREEELEDVVEKPYVPDVRQPLAQDEATSEEIVEVLEESWRKIEEALSLMRYAITRIEHAGEKQAFARSASFLQKIQRSVIMFLAAWDKSRVAREIKYGKEGVQAPIHHFQPDEEEKHEEVDEDGGSAE